MNNPQEIANTFNDYFFTVADTFIRNIKKDNSDSRDNVDPSNYLTNNFNITFSRISRKYATTYEIYKFIISLKMKPHMGVMKSPLKI